VFFSVGAEAAQKQNVAPKDESMRRGETRVTLSPGQFNDARVKEAYKIAKESLGYWTASTAIASAKSHPRSSTKAY
jgi:hypothetical protein